MDPHSGGGHGAALVRPRRVRPRLRLALLLGLVAGEGVGSEGAVHASPASSTSAASKAPRST